MSLVPNEMLHQDPAIIGTKSRFRYRASSGADLIADLTSSPTGVSDHKKDGKKPRKSPKKRKGAKANKANKQAAKTSNDATALPSAPTQVSVVEQENRSPTTTAKKPRSRTFRPANKSSGGNKTPKKATPTGTPLSNQTNTVVPRQSQAPKASVPLSSVGQSKPAKVYSFNTSPFKRTSVPWNAFPQQNRYRSSGSDLNPYATTFAPHFPATTKPGVSREPVSREIFDYYQRNRQTNDNFKSKQILRQSLEHTLKEAYPNHVINLHLVGSSTNGIGDNTSTADFCIIARKRSPTSTANLPLVSTVTDHEITATSTTNEEKETKDNEKPVEPVESVTTSNEEGKVEDNDDKQEKPVETDKPTEQLPEPEEKSGDSSTETAQTNETKPEESQLNEAEKLNEKIESSPPATVVSESELNLESIEKILRSKNFAKNITYIPAKVPILKFKDDVQKLDITLNLNQEVSIRNTRLIRDYAKMDWRFPYLAMILKRWARENHLNSAVDKSISNYGWTLMVVHYLQVTEPPVLPCLQKLVPRRYDQHTNVEQAIPYWRRYPAKWRSTNNCNLRQLLKGIFRYYGYQFQYDQSVISVREGKALDRTGHYCPNADEPHNQWNAFLCVEEPFNRTNTTRSVHDKPQFDRIKDLFKMSFNALRGVRISLFDVIADDICFPINYC